VAGGDPVTYNFDAERWLARQLELLDGRLRRGELDEEACRREREVIDLRYEQMLDRLDGTFQLPGVKGAANGSEDVDDEAGDR
jgi:hypothetical protein